MTRALRARLSYASYKAAHNIPHVPLRDLEAQTQSNGGSFTRTVGQKRKVGGSNNYYNNPATQGNINAIAPGGPRKGAMAPPSLSASASRSYYPNATATSLPTGNRGGANAGAGVVPAQSLYSSILAPPPAKQARTIHNASDPPLPAPSRPGATLKGTKTPAPSGPRRSIAEGTRAQARSRKDSGTTDRRKNKRADKGKQKERITPQSLLADADRDMKAAATLTSLLLQSQSQGHSRGSGSAESPRSSLSNTSDTGSFSHFVQSSARTTTAGSAPPSAEGSFSLPPNRSTTPPGTRPSGDPHTTPKAAPTDTEAADLMLFLATSPSPARPTTNRDRDSKDMAAYRALGGGGGLKGRVLFPGADGGSSKLAGSALSRGGTDGSFASSISSIGSGMGATGRSPPDSPTRIQRPDDDAGNLITHPKSTVTPPTPLPLTPSHLLPPLPSSPSANKLSNLNPSSSHPLPPSNPWPPTSLPNSPYLTLDSKSTPQAPPTPNSVPFNFNDFINVSPSPAHVERGPGSKSNLGLRADVGRKLFEEEQQRQVDTGRGPSGTLGLGAGIDLVQS